MAPTLIAGTLAERSGAVTGVDGLSLTVPAGKMAGIRGPNGAGLARAGRGGATP